VSSIGIGLMTDHFISALNQKQHKETDHRST
jgi:hypothetical protein